MNTIYHINFCVHGTPVGKGRPRMTKTGHTYTPEKTRDYERLVRACYQSQIGKFSFPPGVPLTVKLNAEFPIPQSMSKKRAAALVGKWHTKVPDADNIAKAVLDALQGVAFYNDSAVSKLMVEKTYSTSPCVYVEITGDVKDEG